MSAPIPEVSAAYQIFPAPSQELPPIPVAARWNALLGMPELVCTPPLSSVVSTKSAIVATWGSLPIVGSSYAVPGAAIERSAFPLIDGRKMPSPMSQSAWSTVCASRRCLRQDPNTSETDSLSAPDWPW